MFSPFFLPKSVLVILSILKLSLNLWFIFILTQLAFYGNGKLQWTIRQHITARTSVASFYFFLVTSISISMMLGGVTSFSRIKILQKTCKCLCYSQSSWRDFLSCNGGKLATPEQKTCLFVGSCVLESKKSLANKWFVAQYITGCLSVVSEYITRASGSWNIHFTTDLWLSVNRQWNIHFTTDLQPVIYWATNHCKQESISKLFYS